MALIFMDGFDANDFTTKWTSNAGGVATTTTTRFNSGRAVNIGNYFWRLVKSLPTAAPTIYTGFAIRIDTGGTVGQDTYFSLWGNGGTVLHLKMRLHSHTQFHIARGDNAILGTTPINSFQYNQWNYVEIMATIADSGGRVVMRINGTTVIDFTGDTKNGGTVAAIDTIILGEPGANQGPRSATYYDDLYICDNTGTTNNDFLGDVRIHALPVTGAGSDAQFAPTGSATNWQNVDELPNSTTDYNSSSTPGHRDTYTHQAVPAGVGTIHSLQTNFLMGKSDAGSAKIKPVIRSGGNLYYGSDISLIAGAVNHSIPHDVNPATSNPWTSSAVNTMESGLEIA